MSIIHYLILGLIFSGIALTTKAETSNALDRSHSDLRDSDQQYKAKLDQGIKSIERKDWDGAIHDFSDAILVDPMKALGYEYRGGAYCESGGLNLAINDFTKAIELDPTNYLAYFNRGSAHRAKKEFKKAIDDLTISIQLNSTNNFAYTLRAACYSELGQFEKEISDWTEVLRYTPNDAKASAMRGTAYFMSKQFGKAVSDYYRSIQLDNTNGSGQNALAWFLATCPEEGFRDGKVAIENATEACKLTHWDSADYIDTLAASYAEAGDFRTAIKYQKQALAIGVEDVDRKGMEQRLSLYERNQPYRENVGKKFEGDSAIKYKLGTN